jgi:hypothetical protein
MHAADACDVHDVRPEPDEEPAGREDGSGDWSGHDRFSFFSLFFIFPLSLSLSLSSFFSRSPGGFKKRKRKDKE